MQTLKAGLVLYLHSKKDNNKWLQIHYYYIFVEYSSIIYIYDKASQATSCLLL